MVAIQNNVEEAKKRNMIMPKLFLHIFSQFFSNYKISNVNETHFEIMVRPVVVPLPSINGSPLLATDFDNFVSKSKFI